jgi:hypothetical protein
MLHQEVTIARLLTDDMDQASTLLKGSRIRLYEDSAVLVALCNRYVDIRHILAVQLAFLLFHLKPLLIVSM